MSIGVGATCSPTPQVDSFGELKKQALNIALMPNDTDALNIAGDGIRDAIRHLNNKYWNWALTYHDVTTLLDTADFALPENYKATRFLQRLDSSGNPDGYLHYKPPHVFDEEHPSSTQSGLPRFYTIYNQQDTCILSLDLMCNQSFVTQYPTIRNRYYRRIQLPDKDGDRLIVVPEAEIMILWYARYLVAAAMKPALMNHMERQWRLAEAALTRSDNEVHMHDWSPRC